MNAPNEQCQACQSAADGYFLRFAGEANLQALNEWLTGDKFSPVHRIETDIVWAATHAVPDMLDYFAAHMDAAQITAAPAPDKTSLPTAAEAWFPLADLRAHQAAHWIDDVIAEERVRTVYQPIVSGYGEQVQIEAYEFLSRALDEDGTLIPPYKMFDAARTRGRLFALDRVCRLQAVRNASRVGDRLVFVNFIPTAIYTPEHCLQSTLAEAWASGADPHQIVFEVVETEEIKDLDHLENILLFYRKHGFRYALDDVGSGYSTVENVIRLKPDFVKLDMHYVQGVADDPDKQQVALALLEAARTVGSRTLAEGVETERDWAWLSKAGYELFQGYLFGKPELEPAQNVLTLSK